MKNQESIFFKENVVHPALLSLFSLLNIDHAGTIESIVAQGQKYLLRAPGAERWGIHESTYEQHRVEILSYLRELGLGRSIEPVCGAYDYIIMFGFVTIDVRRHFDFIGSYIQAHTIRPKEIVLLSSSLALPIDMITYSVDCATEAERMHQLFKESSFAHYPYTLIDVPMRHEGGVIKRPTTIDTVHAWLQKKPTPGTILAVSGQPFIYRQARILQKIVSPHFSITSCGPEAQDELPIAVYLDELARALYEENIL